MNVLLKAVLAVAASVLFSPVFAASNAAMSHVDKAIEAQGGEAALNQLRSVAIRGQDVHWEIESSYEPGKAAKPRQGSESNFFIQRDLASGNARIDWDRRVVRTPKPTLFKYSEIVADGIGYVKLGFVTDIWSTTAPLGAKPTPGQMELVAGTKKWGITPERFAPGHGSVAPFAPLVRLVGGL